MPDVLIGLVGDVLVNRDDPHEVFRDVSEVLAAPDILFANLEGPYTDDPRLRPGAISGCVGPAHCADVFAEVGFDVMSLANNHIADAGDEAMLETRARLRALGVATCGAGANLADAREPAIVEAGGLRVAFLAYASVFPMGYEARANAPGLAPLRAYDLWRSPFPGTYVPGTRPLVTTVTDAADEARLVEDIDRARELADLVVTSFHWGDYMRPFHLTDLEVRTARFCVEQGVDMVVGHHHHALRGMEWYMGKPIMYGLGHFVFDFLLEPAEDEYKRVIAEFERPGNRESAIYSVAPRAGWPYLPMHPDTRMTVVAWATADAGGVGDIGFLPCRIGPGGAVHPLPPGSPDSAAVVGYVETAIETQGLAGRVVADGSRTLAGRPTLRVLPP